MSLLWSSSVPLLVLLCKLLILQLQSQRFILLTSSSAFLICDRIGRIWATRVLCTLWMLGIVVFMVSGVNGSLAGVYAGRFIAGLGVGQTPVVGPVYIAEIAPPAVRGLCSCLFTVSPNIST